MAGLKCSDISPRQQSLLMQCYCKTTYNTEFFRYVPEDQAVFCTRGDKDTFHTNTTYVCENYSKYDGCSGVNISPNTASPAVTLSKVALLAIAFSSLLFM
ncbi:hypothetical protein GQ54DRAFT_310015 [Martensiomyces pterosporus]|nr:hypothetical protein GQ54DRAFT_310015 [Martensiomyces pterosporus]